MSIFLYKLWSKFLTVLGNVKVFKWPFFIVYDPSSFSVSGEYILEILRHLKPGDILLRGYDMYLDSYFIQAKRSYSHAGIYIGNNQVIHAVAPNVSICNIIDFCECDRIAIVRPKSGQTKAIQRAKKFLKDNVPYDFNFCHGKETLYCFELAAECYSRLNIPRKTVRAFFGIIRKKNVVLSDSFFESKDFKLIYEYNPKFNINLIAYDR